jgi:hypothetical protein
VGPRISGSVLKLGCRRGELTGECSSRIRGAKGLIVAMDGSPGRLSWPGPGWASPPPVRAGVLRAPQPARTAALRQRDVRPRLLSNLVLGEVPDRHALLTELHRVMPRRQRGWC